MASNRDIIAHFASTAGVFFKFRDVFLGDPPPIEVLIIGASAVDWAAAFAHLNSAYQLNGQVEKRHSQIIEQCFLPDELERIYGGPKARRRVLFDPFAALVALQLCLGHAPANAPSQDLDSMLRKAMQLTYVVSDVLMGADAVETNSMYGSLAAILERSQTVTPLKYVRRSAGLWLHEHEFLDDRARAGRAMFDAFTTKQWGLCLDEYLTITYWLSWGFLARAQKNASLPIWFTLPAGGLTPGANDVVKRALSVLGSTPEQMREACVKEFPDLVRDPAPTLLPLQSSPILVCKTLSTEEIAGGLILSPTHVAECGVAGHVFGYENASSRYQCSREHFGYVVEAYVNVLSRHLLGKRYQRLDKTGLADGFAMLHDLLVVIESKSTLTHKSERFVFRDDAHLTKEMSRKGFDKAQMQIDNTIEWLQTNGRLPGRTPRFAIGLIVTFDPFPCSHIAKEFLKLHIRSNRTVGALQVLTNGISDQSRNRRV